MQTITKPTTSPAPPARLPPYRIHRRRRFLRLSWFFLGLIAHIFIIDVLGNRLWLTRWYAQRSGMRRWKGMARGFRQVAIRNGGVMIKLGQFLSARADVLPAAITDELAGLQDEVPAAPLPYVLQVLVEELGAPPEQLFAAFDPRPVAAASLGQVYFGALHDGREVAIKVQRPRISELVDVDLRAVRWAVRLVKDYPPVRRRANLEALFDEFARVLRLELDYGLEAQNALTFRANFAGVPGVYFPEPYPERSTGRVLVMERIGGHKISDRAALAAADVDQADLAERLNSAYLKQFFLDGFFHADPHPGNLFVRIDGAPQQRGAPAGTPYTLIFVDCGMVGRIPPGTMANLREGIIGLATNDAERMVGALDRMGMILPGADRRPIIQATQVFLRHTYNRSLRELSNVDVQGIFDETEHLIRDLPFQIPQDLIYLGRSVGMVSGMVTAINPDINLFESARPFAEELIARERSDTSWLDQLQHEIGPLAQIALTLPRQMDSYYKAANRGELQVRFDLSRLERSMRRVERATNRLAGGIAATGLFIGGVLLRINGFAGEASWAWAAAGLVLLWVLWPRGGN